MILTFPFMGDSPFYDISGNFPMVKAVEFKDGMSFWSNAREFYRKYDLLYHSSRAGIADDMFINFGGELVPKVFSFSFAPACDKYKITDYYYDVTGAELTKNNIRDIISRKIRDFRSKFDTKIAIENTNYYPYPAYDHITDPDFISTVVYENDIYMVLDIAHAVVTERNYKVGNVNNWKKYIDRLPLDRVVEVHISGIGFVNGIWRDLHEVPGHDILMVLDYVLPRLEYNPYIVVEYYRDVEVLKGIYEQLERRYL